MLIFKQRCRDGEMLMTISSSHGLHCAFIDWYGLVSTSIYPLSACGELNLGTDRQQPAPGQATWPHARPREMFWFSSHLFTPPVARIPEHIRLLSIQQCTGLGDIVDVGRGGDQLTLPSKTLFAVYSTASLDNLRSGCAPVL